MNSSHYSRTLIKNMINFPSILHNFGKNVNFGNFQINCPMNSEIHVFVSSYPYKISVLFRTFFFTFDRVTDAQSLKYKEYSVKCANFF